MEKDLQEAKARPKDEEAETGTADSAEKGTSEEITNENRRIRQAVVVIHGIGEQRPMDTLRSFVDAVLVGDPAEGRKYRSKPDAMSEMLEMRCLQVPASRHAYRPLTDFYEYYWAHHMEGSQYTQVLNWLMGLMWRCPLKIPSALRPVYFVSWGLVLLAMVMWGWGLMAAATGHASFAEGLRQQTFLFAGGLLTFLVQWIGSHFVLGYVADAARYLTPSPGNVEARNRIRSEGIKLLHCLHASGKYNRIVVVGHSLGSVIGYDIIRNLWVDLRKPVVPYPQKQPELKAFSQAAREMETGETTPAKIEAFQQCQHRLWQEFRRVGMPWLITDFITLGAPLTHAQLLMADNQLDFARKKVQYEYPCCPPSLDEDPYYGQQYRLTERGKSVIRNVFIPHHGASFSCIRWTNLSFPYHGLIFGDLIGEPLNGVFGRGIRDLAVTQATDDYLDRTLVSHVCYWNCGSRVGRRVSLDVLRKTLRLDFLRGKSADVNPGFPLQ